MKRQKLVVLMLTIMLILTTVQIEPIHASGWIAEANTGDNSFSSVGMGIMLDRSTGNFRIEPPGGGPNIHGNIHTDTKVNIPYRHTASLPPGTTGVKIHTGADMAKAFDQGPNFNNGHSKINSGQDIIDSTKGRTGEWTDGPHVGEPGLNESTGRTEVELTGMIEMDVSMIANMQSLPKGAEGVLKDILYGPMKGASNADKLAALQAAVDAAVPPFGSHGSTRESFLQSLIDGNDKMAFLNASQSLVIEITETQKEIDEKLKKDLEDKTKLDAGECPTGAYWTVEQGSSSEYTHTTYSTTDLPTEPKTKNHGPCPAEDNAGFTEWDSALGVNFFPKANGKEHWKYWNSANINKGYNKSVHYETRGVVPAATNPPNILKGRPVATTAWTPLADAKYMDFALDAPGRIEYTWLDNSAAERDSAIYREGTNQTKYCVEAYERLLIPEKQKWKHDHYQHYKWDICVKHYDHDSPEYYVCTAEEESCSTVTDKDGNESEECEDVCVAGYTVPKGYHYKEWDVESKTDMPMQDAGQSVDTSENGRIPPVYEPWRKWKHRTEVQVEFHASVINPQNKLLNFNKLDNPKIKSGYGVFYEGQATLETDWDRNIALEAHLIRPNKATPLKLGQKNEPVFLASGSEPNDVSGSKENKDYIQDKLQVMGTGKTIKYSTMAGTWHAYPTTKGGKPVIPKFGPTRQHFTHVDYPDGTFNVESWVNVNLIGGKAPWGVNISDIKGIQVNGNMFSDSFVRPK